MLQDAAFWALVGLVIFLILMVYLKVPGMINRSLDTRADKIRDELDEARKLREEAQELLADYQRKRKAAETEAEDIVAAARHEAELFREESVRRTEEMVTRRTALAEQKIAQAEAQALADVRSTAVDIAVAASEQIIGEKVTGATADQIVKKSIDEIKSRLQ